MSGIITSCVFVREMESQEAIAKMTLPELHVPATIGNAIIRTRGTANGIIGELECSGDKTLPYFRGAVTTMAAWMDIFSKPVNMREYRQAWLLATGDRRVGEIRGSMFNFPRPEVGLDQVVLKFPHALFNIFRYLHEGGVAPGALLGSIITSVSGIHPAHHVTLDQAWQSKGLHDTSNVEAHLLIELMRYSFTEQL